MTKALADLITELQEDVPAVDGVPSDAQYERAIKEAVAEFSRKCGLVKNTLLSIVSGTAAYALPADFLKLIEIDDPFNPEHNIMITTTGIIPFGNGSVFEEELTIRDRTLTIYPTPAYAADRYMEYKAAWVLDGDNEYPLTDDEAEIVLLKAKAIAFEKISNADAALDMKYSIGNMSVDLGGTSGGYSKRITDFEDKFEHACDRYNGAIRR